MMDNNDKASAMLMVIAFIIIGFVMNHAYNDHQAKKAAWLICDKDDTITTRYLYRKCVRKVMKATK